MQHTGSIRASVLTRSRRPVTPGHIFLPGSTSPSFSTLPARGRRGEASWLRKGASGFFFLCSRRRDNSEIKWKSSAPPEAVGHGLVWIKFTLLCLTRLKHYIKKKYMCMCIYMHFTRIYSSIDSYIYVSMSVRILWLLETTGSPQILSSLCLQRISDSWCEGVKARQQLTALKQWTSSSGDINWYSISLFPHHSLLPFCHQPPHGPVCNSGEFVP